jgi:TIR domain
MSFSADAYHCYSSRRSLTYSVHDRVSMTPKRFRIAFTFAGEKRRFVAEVATILAKCFGKESILYDKYHEAEFARHDLGFYLPDLYHKHSDLIVVIISPEYEQKEWCGLEWNATFDLIKQRKDDSVMLCRFNYAQVRGLFSTSGYVELDTKTPDQASVLILQRLALNEGRPNNYYLQEAQPLTRPVHPPIAPSYSVVEPCRFDLDHFTEKSMTRILGRTGLIGFGLSCHSLPLLKQCCRRLKLEIGRSDIEMREPFVIDPKLKTVEMGVRDVLKLRKLLEMQDVLLAVQISDEANANLFWSTLKFSLPADMNHRLIILMALSQGCAFPDGLVQLETPQFERFHAYRWVREIVALMKWPEEFIDSWVDSMIAECTVESAELYPEQVYIHLDETIRFIQETSELADFRAELKRRESIYVPSSD